MTLCDLLLVFTRRYSEEPLLVSRYTYKLLLPDQERKIGLNLAVVRDKNSICEFISVLTMIDMNSHILFLYAKN